MSYTDKVRDKAGEVMAPGEQLLAAIRTMPRGTTLGLGIGGAVGAVVADRQAKKAAEGQGEGSTAAAWPTVRSAVGLTDKRLLVFDYTFTGKPKDLIGEVGLDQVAGLGVDKGLTNKVTFSFNDGSTVAMECAKLEKIDDFVSAFATVKPGAV